MRTSLTVCAVLGLAGLLPCTTGAVSAGESTTAEKAAPQSQPPRELLGAPLVYFDDFEAADAARWQPSDPQAWKFVALEKNHVYSQFQQSQVQTPVRSPFNRSLVKDLVLSDCVIDVKVQSTIKDYDHRDVCLFFGYQDPAHLYYVHLGKKADDHANQIFIVNNAPRKKISATSTPGTPWTDGWHHVRVVRKVETGSIEVFFDDLEKPAMTATDKTFVWGQVGIGTFDDTANFDDVAIYGKVTTRPQQ
ncbi:MAG: hypothetical protein JSS02_15630 [Planctomycetes bacterium]|nr:hypothetical protein [Planctomycetota bacterium]